MRLRLKNIAQHEDLELSMPDSGVVMIQGRSGSGKSTVLDSIRFALYGTGAADLAPWEGPAKRSVELVLESPEEITIVRTGSPASLTVKDSSGAIHRDDAAQEIINRTMKMTEAEFGACSHIEQDQANSLLNYGPADQLRFIESLSSGSINPEFYRKGILSKIKVLEKEMGELVTELHIKTDLLARTKAKYESESSLNAKPEVSPRLEENIEVTLGTIKICKVTIDRLRKESDDAKTALKDPIYSILETAEKDSAALSTLRDDLTKRISVLKSKISEIPAPISKSDIETKMSAARAKVEYWDNFAKAVQLQTSIHERWKDSVGTNLTDFLSNRKTATDSEYQAAVDKVSELRRKNTELSGLSSPQPCPECGTGLVVSSGKICKPEFSSQWVAEEIVKNNSSIAVQSAIADSSKKESGDVNQILFSAKTIKQKLINDPAPDLKDMKGAKDRLFELSNALSEASAVDGAREELNTQLNTALNDLKTLERKMAVIEDSVKKSTEWASFISKDRHEAFIAECNDNMNKTNMLLQTANEALMQLQKEKSSLDLYNKTQSVLDGYKEEIRTLSAQLADLQSKMSGVHAKIAATQRLKELSDFAAVQSTENTIAAINASAESYITKMFPDDGTVIALRNTAMTKDGEERAKISVDAFHKGKTVKKLGKMSGGEKSRCALAFQLGLSDLYESPILMIDEGFKGLSEDDKKSCLEVLKDVSGSKLVLVIEHGAPESFFDHVIRLDS